MSIIHQAQAQSNDENLGNTYYPNGTAYLSNLHGYGQGPLVYHEIDGKKDIVNCRTNSDRCLQLLEEASDYSDTGGGGTEPSPNSLLSLSKKLGDEYKEFVTKQIKIKYGVWTIRNDKWTYENYQVERTNQIIHTIKTRKN